MFGLNQMIQKYPNGNESIIVKFGMFEILNSSNSDSINSKEILESLINDHISGKNKIPTELIQQFHTKLWYLAGNMLKNKNIKQSLEWFTCKRIHF